MLTLGMSSVYCLPKWGFEGTATKLTWTVARLLESVHRVPGTGCRRCDGDNFERMVRAKAREQKTAGKNHRDAPRD